MKRIFFIVLVITAMVSCKDEPFGKFEVTGKITNAPSTKVLLQEMPVCEGMPLILDSTTIAKDGSFVLKGMAKEENLYVVSIEQGPEILIVNDAKNIEVNLDVNNYKAYTTKGSEASTALHTFFGDYGKQYENTMKVFQEADSLQNAKASDSIMTLVGVRREIELKKLNSVVSDFVTKTKSPAASVQVLSMARRTMSPEELEKLVIATANRFKEHSGVQKLKSLMAKENTKPATPAYPLLNQQAPEIAMPSLKGDTIKLSSYKGKFVLVDFWASWCGPCRRENPNVVATYNKYKTKNFTVLGVSLDDDKKDWAEAVAADGLAWDHVSDLKKWETPIINLYDFNAIPFNVLVDPTGKIIASGLTGSELDKKLAEVLK